MSKAILNDKTGRIEVYGRVTNPNVAEAIRAMPEYRAGRSTGPEAMVASYLATPLSSYLSTCYFDQVDSLVTRMAELHHRQSEVSPGGFEFRTKPWKHQEDAIRWALPRYGGVLQMWMGTGKSLVAATLHANWKCWRTVVFAPPKVLGVWRREMAKHGCEQTEVIILDKGTTRKKAQVVQDALKSGKRVMIVVSYMTAWRAPLDRILESVEWDLCLCDESHRIKGPSAKVSRAAYRVGCKSKRRFALTGTLMPHSPLDAYAQIRFIEPAVFGTSFTAFRSRFAVMNHMFPSKVDRFINLDELSRILDDWVFRADADVLDLPPIHTTDIPVDLGAQTKRVYRELEEHLLSEVDGDEVTAANVLVKTIKLRQITGGRVITEDHFIHVGDEKRDTLRELVESMPEGQPVVVFCGFIAELNAIAEVAEMTGRKYGEISGRSKDLDDNAQMPEDIQMMGVQIQSGGEGIDLTRARYVVYYSPAWSLGMMDQSVARVHRPGQNHPVTVYRLVAEGTIDRTMYRALDKRRNVVEAIFEGITRKEL